MVVGLVGGSRGILICRVTPNIPVVPSDGAPPNSCAHGFQCPGMADFQGSLNTSEGGMTGGNHSGRGAARWGVSRHGE